MADTSQMEVPPQTNGLSDGMDDDERLKMRPADIDADVKEMERRKRVDMIMSSKLFREELERIIETQMKDGTGTTGLMQQISDMMGVSKNSGHVFKNSNCVVPINDIRGIEAMGYAKGEKILRCKLAAVYRLIDLYGWSQGCSTLITARLNQDAEHFLVNPYGMLFHEITASSLIKVDMQGNVVEQGTTNFSVNITAFSLHAAIHSSRPDIKCIIHVHTPSVVAISALKCGLLPLSEESVVIGDVSTHSHMGGVLNTEEIEKIARNLGPNNKVLLLTNQGAVCCGQTIEEAFFNARNTVLACESQLKLMPMGVDNLVLITDEQRKKLYEAAHKAPESSPRPDQPSILEGKVERKWRVGGIEFEALMRMLDNAGFRTGYIYRHPLVKGEPPKPKNDVEVPPAVSSLGYLLEEEELYRQGLWKKLEGGRKGSDRTRWLNSPNVYQKVEILETGTPDPKKITKWVADGSPTHSSTPVKIESALQFVPKNTNPKEFKQLQQQIKDYRRADKISAGPQSHILEGVTWEEAKKMQDATVTQTGDQVVLMGAASKGIIQRGFQHNATMYKSPYAKNPFDCVTDEELDEYKRVVERKAKGDFDDTTDYSESEGLSSAQINKRISDIRSPTSVTSETEEESRDEPQVLRIETTQAPKPSQPEVVMSDDDVFLDNVQEVIEQLKITAIEQSPVSRVSVNSTRSMKVVRAYRRLSTVRNLYRTSSYSGLPKGSYLVPNPRHFHLAHYTNINKPMKPRIINLVSGGKYSDFNPNLPSHISYNWPSNLRPTVTINIANSRTITLNISMQTLTEFIYPFAAALNIHNLPDSKTASCQTSYHTDQSNASRFNITEIINNSSSSSDTSTDSCITSEGLSEFESRILKSMHDNIVSEINTRHSSTDFDSSHTIINTTTDKEDEEGQDDNIKQPIRLRSGIALENSEINFAGGDIPEIHDDIEKDSFKDQSFDFEESGYEASNETTLNTSEFDMDRSVILEGDKIGEIEIESQQIISTSQKGEELVRIDPNPIPSENDHLALELLNKEKVTSENKIISDVIPNVDAKVLSMANLVTDHALELVRDYSIFEEAISETMTLLKDAQKSSETINSNENKGKLEDIVEENESNEFETKSANNYQKVETEQSTNIDNKPKSSNIHDSLPKQQFLDTKSDDATAFIEKSLDKDQRYSTVNSKTNIYDNSKINFSNEDESNSIGDPTEYQIENFKVGDIQMCDSKDTNQIELCNSLENNTEENGEKAENETENQNAENLHDQHLGVIDNVITSDGESLNKKQENQNVESKAKIDNNVDNDIEIAEIFAEQKIEDINTRQKNINKKQDLKSVESTGGTENVDAFVPELLLDHNDHFVNHEEKLEGNCLNTNEVIVLENAPIFDEIEYQNIDTYKNVESDAKIAKVFAIKQIEEAAGKNITSNEEIITNEQDREGFAGFISEKLIDNNENIRNDIIGKCKSNDKTISRDEIIDNEKHDQNLNTLENIDENNPSNKPFVDCIDFDKDDVEQKLENVSNDETGGNKQAIDNKEIFLFNLSEDSTSTLVAVSCISDSQSDSNFDCSHESATESEEDSDFDMTEQIEDTDQNNSPIENAQDQLIMNQIKDDDVLLEYDKVLSSNTSTNQDELVQVPKETNDVKNQLAQVEDIDIIHNIMSQESYDEGISDCKRSFTDSDSSNLNKNFDEKVIKLGEMIYEYIVKQCYEVKDLVLFPEVLYDENVIKMFSKLRELYLKYYCDISDEDKNELRINLANYISLKIQSSADIRHDDSSSSGNDSDKLFTISEFISDILDKFFDQYASTTDSLDSWNGFSNLLAEKDMCQSTPEDKAQPPSENVAKLNSNDKQIVSTFNIDDNIPKPLSEEETLTFQAKKSQSGCELYWISINKSPKNKEGVNSRKRAIIDVDSIPLKPPDDLFRSSGNKPNRLLSKRARHSRSLSPIYEEAICSLFDEFNEENSRSSSPILTAHTENFEYRDTTDFLAGGDYVEFEKPEEGENIVVLNEAKFFRGPTADYAYYIQSSGVVFRKNVTQPKQNDTKFSIQSSYLSLQTAANDDEGNWMGYEQAKF